MTGRILHIRQHLLTLKNSGERVTCMNGSKIFLFSFLFIFSGNVSAQKTVALCVVATGKYIQFVKPLIDSAEKYFCPMHERRYIVFTDYNVEQYPLYQDHDIPNITYVYQKKLGWPKDTLFRFDIYLKNKDCFSGVDYIFACDADMLFVDYMGNEILSDRVATQHPGHKGKYPLWGKPGIVSYETNLFSTAYIGPDEGEYYFAGGFYGGSYDQFFQMMSILTKRIARDLHFNYIAVWHDESHLNRYCIDYPPTVVLDRSYCYPEHGERAGYPKCKPKLLALDKDHASMRE